MKIRLLVLSVLLGSLCSAVCAQGKTGSALAGAVLANCHVRTAVSNHNSDLSAGFYLDVIFQSNTSTSKPVAIQRAKNDISSFDNSRSPSKVVLAKTVYQNIGVPDLHIYPKNTAATTRAQIKPIINRAANNKNIFKWYNAQTCMIKGSVYPKSKAGMLFKTIRV